MAVSGNSLGSPWALASARIRPRNTDGYGT